MLRILGGQGRTTKKTSKVKTIKSGLSKEAADAVKARFIEKNNKVYNQSMEVV